MPKKFRVIVVGGSLGGLLAANMLWRAGFDVTVHERIGKALGGRGAGITAHPEMFDAFLRAGVDVTDAIGTTVKERVLLDLKGRIIARHLLPQVVCSWSSLYALLLAAFPKERYFSAMPVTRVDQENDIVRAVFENGTELNADLLVGADGVNSTVRKQMFPSLQARYAGYIAWRGMVEERSVTPEAHDVLFSGFAFCLPPGEHMVGYPIAGATGDTSQGNRRYNLVWYRSIEEKTELKDLMTDKRGVYHPMGIPPKLIRSDVVRNLHAAAEAHLAPQFCEVVKLVAVPFFQTVMDLEVPNMALNRIVLLGDAPFLVRPHLGMGITKAAGDAVLLTDLLLAFQENPEHALKIYSAERCRYGQYLAEHARRLGSQMRQVYNTEEERTETDYYRRPDVCLKKIAVPPDPP